MASLTYACGWVPLTDKQSTTKKTLELMGHLRPVEMHRRSPKTRRNPSVSSHTVSINQPTKQCFAIVALDNVRCANVGVAEVCMWLGPSHRQAKHNEKL